MNEIIYEAYNALAQYAECKGKYVTEKEKNELLHILKKKEYYNEELLRVVMVGRVNSGKSTLTNALVGKKIAYEKRRESTSWNTTFWPSKAEYCIGVNHKNEIDKMSIEEFVEIIHSQEKRGAYLKDKKSIDVFFKTEDVNFSILDVPGFSTQNKKNEIIALEEVRQADVILLLIPANSSVSGDDMALYQELLKINKTIEIVISKSDYRNPEELKAFSAEIQDIFKTKQEIYSISARECQKGDAQAMADRKRLVSQINSHQIYEKELRRKNNVQFEKDAIVSLRNLQQKVLRDIEKKFTDRLREQVELYQKVDEIIDRIRALLKDSAKESYCKPYYSKLVEKMTSISVRECACQMDSILKETIPEEYLFEYWRKQVQNIEKIIGEMWEIEVGNTESLYQYKSLIKNGREGMKNSSRISEKEEKLKGGVESSVSLGAAISFYQAVLGPVAESVTIFGAMSSVGIPIAAVGIAITAILSSMASSEQKNLSKEDAQKFLEDELTKKSNEIIYQLLDVSRILNNQHVADEIMLQEERLINSLPEGLQDLDLTIECLENLGTVLWNREIELQELLDFYNAHPIEKIKEIVYIDPVEYEIDCFTKRLNALKTPAYIDTSCRAVFMPILFLSEENKEHIFSILHELCAKTQTFISKISKSRFEHSYYYEDKICAIYFSQMTGQKKIQLEYIDVFARDEQNVLNFRGKIREGSILTDCQMRRKILCDISRAKEKVEILVPWMNNSINDSFSYYKNYSFKSSMCQAIEQALENGATVVVGCGNSENSNKDLEVRSKETKEKLEEKLKKYCEQKKLIFHMRSFTHEKFLIVDDRIALCGSYNFLSNKGQFIDRINTPLSKSSIFDMHQGRRSSDEREFPGESMKLTENIESIRIIRSRMEQKYN